MVSNTEKNMKRVLIIDESTFSRVCSALLELEGYRTKSFSSGKCLPEKLNYQTFCLLITSYPLDAVMLEKVKTVNLPTIILTDHVDREILRLLDNLPQSFCMVKPLDYEKFRFLVNEIAFQGVSVREGYSVF